jgi:hypothetical protein
MTPSPGALDRTACGIVDRQSIQIVQCTPTPIPLGTILTIHSWSVPQYQVWAQKASLIKEEQEKL